MTMLRRSLLNCRIKTRVTILGLSVVAICSLLLYQSLTSPTVRKHINYDHTHQHISQGLHFTNKQQDYNNIDETIRTSALNTQMAIANSLNETDLTQNTYKMLTILKVSRREALITFLVKLYPSNWADALETDEVALDLKYLLIDYGLDSNMSCKKIDSMKISGPFSHSGSQLVDYAYDTDETGDSNNAGHFYENSYNRNYDKSTYIVKSSSHDQEAKFACMKQVYDERKCAAVGNYRLLREVILLKALKHPNIVTLKGYCLRGSRVSTHLHEKGLIVVTEMGTPLTMTVISSSTWSQKLSMALGICKLLLYLDKSPLGSLRFKKLNLKDFVLVQETIIKLSHLDEIEIGDKECTEDSDCGIRGSKDIICKNGRCEGMNHIISFKIAAKDVLFTILENPPTEEEVLLAHLRNQDISVREFVNKLEVSLNKSKHENRWPDPDIGPVDDNSAHDGREFAHGERHHIDDTFKQSVLNQNQQRNLDQVMLDFVRYDRKNFAGVYDYKCVGTRVTWGCVFTVTSLLEAANLCLQDTYCKCFVTFSVQPESDNLMTVVLKNSTDSSPHKSSSTTLFIRRTPLEKKEDFVKRYANEDNVKNKEEIEAPISKSVSGDVHKCLDRLLQSQDTARYIRERRLMTHLGLKGKREQVWRREAMKLNTQGQSELVKAKGGGGRFTTNLTRRGAEDGEVTTVRKAVFIAEDGPHMYHMAYAVIYHLDRLLGLYHVPPVVGKLLSENSVLQLLKNSRWKDMFRSLIESDGTLSGLLAAPMPPVMKIMKLKLQPLESMTNEINLFNGSEKFELEYILQWWLGRIDYTSSDHEGFKDHLVHFYADKAFGNFSLDKSGYLNHCQFPSIVYNSLQCFLCTNKLETTETQSDNVCHLGEEAFKRSHAMFADDSEFFIHNMKEDEIVASINNVASAMLSIVNSCIKTFGRKNVLY